MAHGLADGNGASDLIGQYFLLRVLDGASIGRAALLARSSLSATRTRWTQRSGIWSWERWRAVVVQRLASYAFRSLTECPIPWSAPTNDKGDYRATFIVTGLQERG
jgi:hypothetical protein